MNFLKFITLAPALIISGILFAADCDLKHLEGKSYYGAFNFYSGTSYLMYMQVDKVKGCKIEGTFLWPDYFYSKTTFSGSFDGDRILISEDQILQGMIMDIERSDYTIDEMNEGTLSGMAYVDGEDMATFRVKEASVLEKDELDTYKERFDELAAIYGETIIGKPAKISLEELKASFQENNTLSDAGNVKITGVGVFSQMEFPMIMYYKPPQNFYMEMEFQNLKFMMGRNDSISWSYDPTSDQVGVDQVSEDQSDSFEQFSAELIGKLDGELENLKINHASVGGVSAYRLSFKKDGEPEAHYLSKDNYLLIRQEENFEIQEYHDYIEFKGVQMPQEYRQFSPGGVINLARFETIQEAGELNDDLFTVPESLKSKIAKDEAPSVAEMGNEAFESGDYERAAELYSRAIDNYPYDDILYFNRGKAYYELEQNYKALGDFERAKDLNDEDPDYHNFLGLVKYRFGDYSNALEDFQIALQKDSLHNIAYLNAAFCHYHMSQPDSALIFLDLGLANDSTDGQFHLNRGIINYQLKNFETAISDYRRTLQLEYGDSASIQNRLGVCYFRLDAYDTAASYFKKALQVYPENYQMQKNLANAYHHNGQHRAAIEEYHKAYELNAEDDDLLNYMALSYYEDNDFETSIHYLNEAIELNDENAYYFDNRAYAYAGMMRYQEAIDDFSRSIELYSKDPEVYYQRGIVYKLQNSRFDACRDFKTASQMEHEGAREELEEYCQMASAGLDE